MTPTEQRLERALSLICNEWGKTRSEALAWLDDNDYEWRPAPESRPESTGLMPFIQVMRTTTVLWPDSVPVPPEGTDSIHLDPRSLQ